MLEIEELTRENEYLFDGYVAESKNATFYHTLGWRNIIQKVLGHRPYYLIAKEDNEIKGALPLFLVKSIFFGKYLSSVPAANYCGVCADEKKIRKLLVEKAKELAHILKVDYFELREFQYDGYGIPCDKSHLIFLIPLNLSADSIWHKLNKNVRSSIRKAIRSGLKSRWYFNEWRQEFYEAYLHTMKRLGSPAYSTQFFETILKEFPDNSCIVSVEYKGRVIASDLIVFFKNTVLALFSGAYREFFHLCPNNFISWEEIRYGCEKGFEFYDFGRSQWNTGSFNFKKFWNGKIYQLHYYYYLNKTAYIPIHNPNHPKYQFYIKVWKKLPVFINRRLGQRIIKYLN